MAPIKRKNRKNQAAPKGTASVSTLEDLNEHCMQEIFRHFSPLDMCAVRDTSVRLREVADNYMETFYKSKELVLDNRDSSAYKVFVKFGAVLSKLHVDETLRPEQNTEILLALRELNPILDSLTIALRDTDFELVLSRLRPLLRHLRKVRFEYFDNDFESDIRREETIKAVYRACTNVEELSFGAKLGALGSCYQGIFLQQKFKHLHSLELSELRQFDVNNLKIFFKRNPNVRRLSLKCCAKLDVLNEFDLARIAPNIEGLALKFSVAEHALYKYTPQQISNQFIRLEKLKCLALDTCETGVTDMIADMATRNSLVYLSLTNLRFKINERLGDTFANMINLKVLRLHIFMFCYKMDADSFKNLCTNLVNLEQLHLLNGSVVEYQHIGDIIEHCVNLRRFYLPSLRYISGGVLDTYRYLDYVQLQSRKQVTFPLTIFVENSFSFPTVMNSILECSLQAHRDVVKVSQFNPADFDAYDLPQEFL